MAEIVRQAAGVTVALAGLGVAFLVVLLLVALGDLLMFWGDN